MPRGLGFLNGDFPPPFFLSPSVTGLAFRVRFGFLTEKSRPWDPFQIFPPSSPSHPCCLCQSPKKRKRCFCQDFSGKGREALLGFQNMPREMAGTEVLTLHLSTDPQASWGWRGPAQRHGRLTCRGNPRGKVGDHASVGEEPSHYLPTSPISLFRTGCPSGGLHCSFLVFYFKFLMKVVYQIT